MRMEARLGEYAGVTEPGAGERLDGVLRRCGLPEVLEPPLDIDELLERARPDKKGRAGELRWVLLARIGQVAVAPDGGFTHALSEADCRTALDDALRAAFEAADSPA
jgi:3-dehydroquinate synthetase